MNTPQLRKKVDHVLSGVGGMKRMTSVRIASKYGNEGLSAAVGSRPRMTVSISSWAFRWMSGYDIIVMKNVMARDVICVSVSIYKGHTETKVGDVVPYDRQHR